MATVTLKALRKFFGNTQVLHGVNLSIEDQEFVVLVGPSGCGKSTLLRMVAGLEEISAGTIEIDGVVVNDLPPKQRNLAMVFQSYALYPHMTVAENMGFGLRLAKVPKGEIDVAVARAADVLGLGEYLARYPRHLSGGQRQRVAMGRAITRNPKLFLFDEPLSNLDAQLRGQMRAEIKSLHQRLGATTIYVTHDQTEAMTMADRIVVLRDGRVEQIGPPMEIYGNPRTEFVAGFIGSPPMNMLSGRLERRDGGAAVVFDDGVLVLSEPPDLPDGAAIRIGVRPSQLRPCEGDAVDTHLFTVELVEPSGDTMELKGRIFGQPASVVAPYGRVERGDVVPLTITKDAPLVFDPTTGARV